MLTILYYLGLAALFTHEMDAVMRSEWRLLYVLRSFSDDAAYPLFLALHFPLFFVFLWLSHHRNTRTRDIFRLLVAAFLVVHAGLHYRLSTAPLYEFSGVMSNVLIYSAAGFGFAYAILWFSALTARLTRCR